MSVIGRSLRAIARPLLGTVIGVDTSSPAAALTFDDGPDPEYTPRLLDVLDRHGAAATFFLVGERAARYPAMVRRIAEAGHSIGNHTWSHSPLPSLSAGRVRKEIRGCASALEPHGAPLFRSPGGRQTPRDVLIARLLGYRVVGWNVDPRDYGSRSAEEIAEHVLRDLAPGRIILLHDALHGHPGSDRRPTIDAVDHVLGQTARTYEFLKLPDLFRRGQPHRVHAFWNPGVPHDASIEPGG